MLVRQADTTIAQAEKRRKDAEPQGRCHQLSGCVSCTRLLRRRQRQRSNHAAPALRCRRGRVGGKLSVPLADFRWCFGSNDDQLEDRRSFGSSTTFRRPRNPERCARLHPSGRRRAKSPYGLSLISSFGWMPDESFGFPRVEELDSRR